MIDVIIGFVLFFVECLVGTTNFFRNKKQNRTLVEILDWDNPVKTYWDNLVTGLGQSSYWIVTIQ